MKESPTINTNISHYRILSKIGAGGMGEVYLAQDTKLDRKVALKILPVEVAAHPDRMKRFVQEAKTASALNHPNIITIYEVEQIDSVNFIATEFIDGETLRQRMRSLPMKLSEVLDVAAQIASALAAAHEAGIIHRDIKPENIMLRKRDAYVKVLDFGLAKLTEQRPAIVDTEAPTKALFKTEEGVVMGTVTYMSPEQARGLEVDARTDIFSLGVLIYETITGRLPFEGSNTYEIVASILSDKEAPPVTRYAPEAPAELERILAKTLRKDRDERYQNIKDLLLDLKNLKARLAFETELDRSGASGRAADDVLRVPLSRATSAESKTAPALSAKQRTIGALIAIGVMAGAVVGISLYVRGRSSTVAIKSIAVLPFVNQNNDPNTEYLADGIPESIINTLPQFPNLKVMSRNSAFHYKGKEMDAPAVARELNVQAILTGRIAQHDDGLSIGVELINVQDNSQIWGQRYSRKLSDLFAVQDEIAKEISEKLRAKLLAAERPLAKRPTENLKAFQYYSQGRSYYGRRTREDLGTTIGYYEQAIAEDQNYAIPYAGLAYA